MLRRGLATLVRAEVVMTGGDILTVTQQHPAGGRPVHPEHARPSPDQEHRGWNTAALGPIGFSFMQMPSSMMC